MQECIMYSFNTPCVLKFLQFLFKGKLENATTSKPLETISLDSWLNSDHVPSGIISTVMKSKCFRNHFIDSEEDVNEQEIFRKMFAQEQQVLNECLCI